MFDDILFEQHGPVGLITLNRVKALNALSHDMVKALAAQLDIWAGDETIKVVGPAPRPARRPSRQGETFARSMRARAIRLMHSSGMNIASIPPSTDTPSLSFP